MTVPNTAVTVLQASLVTRGMQPGPIDGVMGPQTLRAMAYLVAGTFIGLEDARELWAAMQARLILTPLRMTHFLANCGAESGFALIAENLNYTAKRLMEVWPSRFPSIASTAGYAGNPVALANKVYGDRMGNTRPNDGWNYRGRGFPQLTGREAYRIIGRMTDLPLETDPDLMLSPRLNAHASAAFWDWKGLSPLADIDDGLTIRKRWNGGVNGWPAVQSAISKLKAAWGIGG